MNLEDNPASVLKKHVATCKDENGRKKSRPIPPVFLYLFCPFLYLRKNTEMGWEAGGGVSRPYLRDPVFNRDNFVFSCIYKIWKNK